MPGTWAQVTKELGWKNVDPRSPKHSIYAGAYYMQKLRRAWSAPRPDADRHALAQASYNAGLGNILATQRFCGGATGAAAILKCLPQVTGRHATETLTYVERIARWQKELTE